MTGHDSRSRNRVGDATGHALASLVVLAISVPAWPEGADDGAGGSPTDREVPVRVSRLQDSLAVTQDWEIGVPESRPATTFEDRIRTGSALDSQAYLALDSELRRARLALAETPQDRQAQQRLEALRRALAARVESNMELGYFYAARVYIALFEDAGAPPEQVATYRQRLAEVSQS